MTKRSLEVLFEDDNLIAVNKKAGHIVHPADEPKDDDIVVMKLVRDYCDLKIYPTHRLDRPTCGVLLFAKNKTSARAMNRAFERQQVKKVYHAVVFGQPECEHWTWCEELQKTLEDKPKEAVTEFRVLKKLAGGLTLLEARPRTGRYHQIRKHLLSCGTPILGDYRYAGLERCEEWDRKLGLDKRMFLQCRSLTFAHPVTAEVTTVEAGEEECFRKLFES